MPLWLLSLLTTRVFALSRRQYSIRNGVYIAYAAIVSGALFTLINYFYFTIPVSRALLLIAIVASFIIIWLWHIVFEALWRSFLVKKQAFKALIIGVNRESSELVKRLQLSHHPFVPVAILDGRGAKEKHIHGVPVLGKLNKLEDTIRNFGITHLIQCSDLEQSLNLLSVCRTFCITYVLLPSVLGIVERDERIETLEGQPVTLVSPPTSHITWFFR